MLPVPWWHALEGLYVTSFLNRRQYFRDSVDVGKRLIGLITNLFWNCRYKVTKGLLDRFGEKRVIDSPITESGFCGLTVGAALAGLHPVVGLHDIHTILRTKLTYATRF